MNARPDPNFRLSDGLDEAATRSNSKPLVCRVRWMFTPSIPRREPDPPSEDFASWRTTRSLSSGSTSPI